MFSKPHQGEGGGRVLDIWRRCSMGIVSVTNGQCPLADDKLVRAKYWMFFSKSFLCRMTRLIPGATTPLPSQIFLRTRFCQFCQRSSATWTKKNTWKHQILAKSHTNYFGRLAAKFQQTAISSICLGAFKRFSTMISASFGNLISARRLNPIYLPATQLKICQALLCFPPSESWKEGRV